jgi:hypothetical protein
MSNEDKLRQQVLETVKSAEAGLSISQVEDALRDRKVEFRRDDLRSVVWRLAAAQLVRITPESRIVAEEKTELVN